MCISAYTAYVYGENQWVFREKKYRLASLVFPKIKHEYWKIDNHKSLSFAQN